MSKAERLGRAEARRNQAEQLPIRSFRLGEEPVLDLRVTTTVDERLREVLRLSYEAFRLSGQPFPSYSRAEIPGRVIRKSGHGTT